MPIQTYMTLDDGKILISTIERKYVTMEGEYSGWETLVFLLDDKGKKGLILSQHNGPPNLNVHFNVSNRYWHEGLSASELYIEE